MYYFSYHLNYSISTQDLVYLLLKWVLLGKPKKLQVVDTYI
jgi:hypothetical protein